MQGKSEVSTNSQDPIKAAFYEGKKEQSPDLFTENLHLWTQNIHLRHLILGLAPSQLPTALLSTIPSDCITLISPIPHANLRTAPFPSLFAPPPKELVRASSANRNSRGGGPALQLTQQEDPNGGSTWLVIRPERSKSQGGGLRRRGEDDDEESSLSISIGPDNSVMVDSGRRRR